MKEESLRVSIEGHLLHRLILHPDAGTDLKAKALFYHGQGDFAERYLEVLYPFTKRGICCVITELPGHGYSPGRRGHAGDETLLDAIIEDSLAGMQGMPYGVMGHSMGGLLAVRHLVLAGKGRLPLPSFAWLSSPLMTPSQRRSRLFVRLAHLMASVAPSLTVSTGVKASMCRVKQEGQEGGQKERDTPKHQLWHSRISFGWGAALMDIETDMAGSMGDIPDHIPLIYTQGGADPICPAGVAREIFQQLPNIHKEYHEFKELLHEPFRGEGSEQLFKVLERWLDEVTIDARLT